MYQHKKKSIYVLFLSNSTVLTVAWVDFGRKPNHRICILIPNALWILACHWASEQRQALMQIDQFLCNTCVRPNLMYLACNAVWTCAHYDSANININISMSYWPFVGCGNKYLTHIKQILYTIFEQCTIIAMILYMHTCKISESCRFQVWASVFNLWTTYTTVSPPIHTHLIPRFRRIGVAKPFYKG